ncbi:MAG: peroxiredoxin [Planctomycetota bacterium]
MLTIGDRFPHYALTGVTSTDPSTAFQTFTPETSAGRWRLLFFYPKDFTFVCPTEIKGFGDLARDFSDRDTDTFAVSTDNEFVHLAWKRDHADLRDLPIPMLSDLSRGLSDALGILDPVDKVARRATFLVDPEGVIRFVSVNDGSVGRNPEEVLRVLDALQTDELCPCNWKRGEETLHVA